MRYPKSFLVLLIVIFIFNNIIAQESVAIKPLSQRKKYNYEVLKTNPLAFFSGPCMATSELGLSYDFSLGKRSGISFGASLLTKNVFIYLAELSSSAQNPSSGSTVIYVTPHIKISGYRLQAQYKFLIPFGSSYPNAFYFGPHASYASTYMGNEHNIMNTDYYRIIHKNISLLMGFQMFLGKKVYLDIYQGLGYKNNNLFYYKNPKSFIKEESDFIFTGMPNNLKISLGIYMGWIL
ncbi:MAG: DUF3575 domain-containing protein [Bacteroidales bacterium]|nr:DUF3575 domain-containing protein [Bacteroidales bacterium]